MKQRVVLCIVFILLMPSPALSASPLLDPGITAGERMVYAVTEGNDRSQMRCTIDIDGEDKGYYRLTVFSEGEMTEVSIDRKTMMGVAVYTTRFGNDYRVRSSTIIEGFPSTADDEIKMIDMTGLLHSLRGYPFAAPREMRITFFSSDDDRSDFRFTLDYGGTEQVLAGGKRVECYRLEMSFSMTGIFAAFSRMVPKTVIWYSVEPPHYPVKYQGQNGPPGTPLTTIELIEYSGW